MNLKEIDATVSEIAGKIDFYSHLTPVNLKDQKERFFKAVKAGKAYDPVFEYKERPDLSGEKDELLDALGVLDKTDPLARPRHSFNIKARASTPRGKRVRTPTALSSVPTTGLPSQPI